MDYLNDEILKELNLKIQDFQFKKSKYEEVEDFLNHKNLSLETFINNLTLYEGYDENVDLILGILDKLFRWPQIKNDFIQMLFTLSEKENVLLIKSPNVKKYLIKFISENLKDFCDKNITYVLLKLYLVDDNSGVFENCLNLLINLLQFEPGKNFITQSNFIENLLNYLELIKENNSIILIRELEIILEILKIIPHDSTAEELLKKISSSNQFFKYDILTQLTFLDTIGNKISDSDCVSLILSQINFFQELQNGTQEISNILLRKFLYTLSKFYAGKALIGINLVKNLLAISIQYYMDNQSENNFIISVMSNIFHNHEIFLFLIDAANNTQFDFCLNTLQIFVENYNHSDPKIIEQILDVISIIGNFSIPSMTQEQFFFRFVRYFYSYHFNKNPADEQESWKFFFDKIYKDFRTHDFEEYEAHFLDCVLSLITYPTILKIALGHLDFILFILNRRNRPQDILEKKYNIINYIHKNSFGNQAIIDKNIYEQFTKYISKGPF